MNFDSFLERLDSYTPPLAPTQIHDTNLSSEILAADLFPNRSGAFVDACRAGLLLWSDDLDAAHKIVQAPENEINNYWHAILHRREADFSNARYWWRRVGTHASMEGLYDVIIHRVPDFPLLDELRTEGRWEPLTFNTFCENAAKTGEWDTELREVQRLEIKLLLEWCAAQVK